MVLTGCGSRGPLDLGPTIIIVEADASVDATPDATPIVDAGKDVDAAPPPTLVDCGLCVGQKCGSGIVQCLQNSGCSQVLQCVGQDCLTAGLDLACLTKCGGSDPQSALAAAAVAECVIGTCGSSCGSVLSSLGGAGGLGLGGQSGGGG